MHCKSIAPTGKFSFSTTNAPHCGSSQHCMESSAEHPNAEADAVCFRFLQFVPPGSWLVPDAEADAVCVGFLQYVPPGSWLVPDAGAVPACVSTAAEGLDGCTCVGGGGAS
eukprot:1162019-Pelagomonas_calceolata.AAC.2